MSNPIDNPHKIFSIVVSVYQSRANLHNTVPKLLSLQEKLPNYKLDLVFVNDGSKDDSHEILAEYFKLYPDKISVVKFSRNFGQTPAIQAGLAVAQGSCIGIISADLQDPYELFITMVEKWEKGVKLVIAEREKREDRGGSVYLSKTYNNLVNKFVVNNFPAGGFDFCLMDRQVRDDLIRINEKNTAIFPLIFWLGYNYEILPYTRKLRTAGASQWTFAKKIKLAMDTFVGFSYLPVRLVSLLGLIVSFMAFLYTTYVILRWAILGTNVVGWASIVILVSGLGGLILLSLGIVGEYLWRILDETRKRPPYVIDEILKSNQNIKPE